MDWKPDWGLRGRMVLTMFLLFALYVVFMGVLTFYFRSIVFSLILMGGFLFVQYFFSDKLALYSMGAKEVSEEEYPELHAMIGRLSQQADLPKPKVAVADAADLHEPRRSPCFLRSSSTSPTNSRTSRTATWRS